MEQLINTITTKLHQLADQPPAGFNQIDLTVLYRQLTIIIEYFQSGQNRQILLAMRALIENIANLDPDNLVYGAKRLTTAITNGTSN